MIYTLFKVKEPIQKRLGKNGFKPFPLKPRNINRLIKKINSVFPVNHALRQNISRIKLCFLGYEKDADLLVSE